jgi:hypothetical protein
MKHSIDAIGNQIHNLLACSALAQPAVLPHAPFSLPHCVVTAFSDTLVKKNSGGGRESGRSGHRIGRVSSGQHITCVTSIH